MDHTSSSSSSTCSVPQEMPLPVLNPLAAESSVERELTVFFVVVVVVGVVVVVIFVVVVIVIVVAARGSDRYGLEDGWLVRVVGRAGSHVEGVDVVRF